MAGSLASLMNSYLSSESEESSQHANRYACDAWGEGGTDGPLKRQSPLKRSKVDWQARIHAIADGCFPDRSIRSVNCTHEWAEVTAALNPPVTVDFRAGAPVTLTLKHWLKQEHSRTSSNTFTGRGGAKDMSCLKHGWFSMCSASVMRAYASWRLKALVLEDRCLHWEDVTEEKTQW